MSHVISAEIDALVTLVVEVAGRQYHATEHLLGAVAGLPGADVLEARNVQLGALWDAALALARPLVDVDVDVDVDEDDEQYEMCPRCERIGLNCDCEPSDDFPMEQEYIDMAGGFHAYNDDGGDGGW